MSKKLVEIETKREERPDCKFCGYDGNYNSMRSYHEEGDESMFPRTEFCCDICGHTCATMTEMKNEIEGYKYGFSDYKVDPK